MRKSIKNIIVFMYVAGCIGLVACGNGEAAPVNEPVEETTCTTVVITETEESTEEMTVEETVEETTKEETSEEETTEMETTVEETTIEEEEIPPTPAFVITEEEFTHRVMFRPSMELMPIEDEYSIALVAAIDAQLASYGREKQYKEGMMGRSYPIRFGEDVNVVADGIVMDIESFFFDGGNSYDIHHVKKADNGYIVSYSVE